jgi:hypothetical protein
MVEKEVKVAASRPCPSGIRQRAGRAPIPPEQARFDANATAGQQPINPPTVEGYER